MRHKTVSFFMLFIYGPIVLRKYERLKALKGATQKGKVKNL